LTAVKVTFMTMTLVTLVTAVKFDYGTVLYCTVLSISLYCTVILCTVCTVPGTLQYCPGYCTRYSTVQYSTRYPVL
jgi:hypothetical protein